MSRQKHNLTFRSDQLVIASNAGLFVSPGHGIHSHRKIETYELIHVRSGQLHMHEDDRLLTVRQGQSLLLHPDRWHCGAQPYDKDVSFYWMHFQLPKQRRSRKGTRLHLPQISQPRRPEQLIALLHHLIDDRLSGLSDDVQDALLMNLILCEAARTLDSDSFKSDSAAAALAASAETYLQEHSTEPISTSDVAEHLQCNPDYLGRVFKQAFGYTLTEALHRFRVREAGRLLQQSSMTVEQIATHCGFGNSGYLRRIFHRHTGLSPRQYGQLHRRAKINRS